MKKSTLNPAAYGLTVDEATRLVRLHDMCVGTNDDDFDQMETAARSIQLVNSLKKLDSRIDQLSIIAFGLPGFDEIMKAVIGTLPAKKEK